MAAHRPEDPIVPLADLEVAGQIADALKRAKTTSTRTVDEIVAAFGDKEPTETARRRAAAALHMARVRLEPDLHFVPRGEPVTMSPLRSRRQRAAIPLSAAMVFAFGVASFVFSLGTGDKPPSGGSGVSSAANQPYTPEPPPAGLIGATPLPAPPTGTVPAPTPIPTPAFTTPAKPRAPATKHVRKRSPAAASRRGVSVRLVPPPSRASFVCVDDGRGHTLFNGNLTSARRFRARVIRINIGLASTTVLVNGRALALHTSPDGYTITRHGHTHLPLGHRPCSG